MAVEKRLREPVSTRVNVDEVRSAAEKLISHLYLPGREEEARLIALALLTGEHAVLIGPPGTAKSMLIRRAAQALNTRYFEYLVTKFTLPEEILGYPDIKRLRDEGRFVYITSGRLPDAEIAFLDEIFKGSSAILNALLSILNERTVFDGEKMVRTNIWAVFGASNEVPEEPELRAMYDRFLYRHFLKPVRRDHWEAMLDTYWRMHREEDRGRQALSIDLNVFRNAGSMVYDVDITPVKRMILNVFARIEDMGIEISDRRKGRALKAVATNALLRGSTTARPEDLLALKYILPRYEGDVEKVTQAIYEVAGKSLEIRRTLQEIMTQLGNIYAKANEVRGFRDAAPILEAMNTVYTKLSQYGPEIRDYPEYTEVINMLTNIKNTIMEKISQELQGV